ncbi:ATP-grasp domain-containing protein [Haloactinospora alba]|uniref:ATP-grasp domain-containing protein n=1 Tax=Haloactinospora alba TaxID=405555 RepID=UPI00114D780A|nr:ATP-grasp domain-containing protein [Haloactinospora alba]
MVTAAGSAATPSTVLHLRRHGFRVVATDTDPEAPGLYLADRSYLVPSGDSGVFLPELRAICRREQASALVPLVDEELVPAGELEDKGMAVLLPRAEFVATCLDKYVLMRRLAAAGLPVPATRLFGERFGSPAPPLVVKPRSGRGSRGVRTCATAEEYERLSASGEHAPENTVVQEWIGGTEFTVSVVCWRDGTVQAVVPKEVVLKRGVTTFAVSREHPRVSEVCRAVQHELRADGPFNVQLALDGSGEPRIFEINPRFSSTAPLTAAAGVDEIAGLILQARHHGPRLRDTWRSGVVMVRRCTEEFLTEEEFSACGIVPGAETPRTARPADVGSLT